MCDKRVETKDTVVDHLKTIHGINNTFCPVCEERFCYGLLDGKT